MTSETSTKAPAKFWVISSLFLIWNLLGLMAFFLQIGMSEEALSKMSEAEQALYASTPVWVNAAFAVAVFGGTVGCILLLMRRSWAQGFFIASLIGVVVQNFYSFVIADVMQVYGPGSIAMPIMVLLGAIFLIWFTKMATCVGWLR